MSLFLPAEAEEAAKSLRDHPNLDTPAAIAKGPYGHPQFEERHFQRGLEALEAKGLAGQATDGTWGLSHDGEAYARGLSDRRLPR